MPLDIGVGIFAAIITSRLTGLPLNWQLVFVSALFSILPDIDVAIYLVKKRKFDKFAHEHRDILHHPIIYTLSGFIILSFWSFSIAWLFAAMSFWHFLHDSIPEGGGWGLRWLYPFSKKYYKFFSGPNGKFEKRFAISWTKPEQRRAAERYGDPEWARHYLQREFIFEMIAFIIAIVTLIIAWK